MNETAVTHTIGNPREIAALPRARGAANTALVIFDELWRGTVLGAELDVELRMVPLGRGLGFQFTGGVSELRKTWLFEVVGNAMERFELMFGLSLIVSITHWSADWSAAAGQIRFDLSVRVVPPCGWPRPLVVESVAVVLPSAGDLDRSGVRRPRVGRTRRPGARAECARLTTRIS